jgi:hypothetical protein
MVPGAAGQCSEDHTALGRAAPELAQIQNPVLRNPDDAVITTCDKLVSRD